MTTFADRLRLARTRLNWTQKQLAQASGLSQSAIGNYESGQRFSSRAIVRLAHALQVTPEWLEGGRQATAYPPAAYPVEDGASQAPWPFLSVPFQDYMTLTQRDRELLENTVRAFVHTCQEAYRHPGGTPPEGGSTRA